MTTGQSSEAGSSPPADTRTEFRHVNDFSAHTLKTKRVNLKVTQEYSRQIIAFTLVLAYVVLLGTNIFLPTWLYLQNKPAEVNLQMSDIKDLTLTISSALSGLVGILGFIMGYYFKTVEQEKKEEQKLQES